MRTPRTSARFEPHGLALFAALALGSAAATAQAQSQSQGSVLQASMPQPAPRLAHNGALQQANTAFDRADANGDGRLSREEAQRLPAVAERFDGIDSDGDRALSREEFQRGVAHESAY